MALLDDTLYLCDGVSLNTGGAGVYLIGSQIDTNTVRDLGNGKALYLCIDVKVGITVASSTGTVQFALASDDSDSISTSASTVHYLTATFATSTTAIAAGTRLFCCQIPQDGAKPYKQFLGILQLTGTTAINAGSVNVFLTTDPGSQRYYPNGI